MEEKRIAHIDYETKSTIDIKACGVYRYAKHASTDILCMAYAFNHEPVLLWTPDQMWPEDLAEHMLSGGLIFAHNAQFERLITTHIAVPRYGAPEVDLRQWVCTAAMAAAMALPRSLEKLGHALGTEIQKDMAGSRHMLKMTKPRKGTPKK
jgi:DNA polymerase